LVGLDGRNDLLDRQAQTMHDRPGHDAVEEENDAAQNKETKLEIARQVFDFRERNADPDDILRAARFESKRRIGNDLAECRRIPFAISLSILERLFNLRLCLCRRTLIAVFFSGVSVVKRVAVLIEESDAEENIFILLLEKFDHRIGVRLF